MALQLWLYLLWATAAASAASLPRCPDKCGNITIPYPFGIGDGCYRRENEYFRIDCNHDTSPPKAFIGHLEVIEASLDAFLVKNLIAYSCHDERHPVNSTMSMSPFTYSQSRNRFTVIGCAIEAWLNVSKPMNFISGCTSICGDTSNVINGSCPGIGCCQTGIPKGLNTISISSRSLSTSQTTHRNECGYAFLGHERVQFDESDLYHANFSERASYSIPRVLDWVAGTETCEEAQKNQISYACRENSECIESTNGPGYKCGCLEGYRGNPYIHHGCQDINECEEIHPCSDPDRICSNTIGGYTCDCRPGTYDDGRSCVEKKKSFPVFQTVLAVGFGFFVLLITGSLLYRGLNQRRQMKLREKFFTQNGGLLLQQQISLRQGATETSKIFTAKELQNATNNYAESQIIGKGGYGTVYKGILSDNRIVAIKRSKIIDQSQIEQFINEVFILSQVNHRNVVKLLGCCLETEVPLLVYEYVPNGTLFHHIHDEGHVSSLPWLNRLRIATETAGALAYLHSAASTPIFHRDVKSTNILLDDNYRAKVSDFGASRLVPVDKTQMTTLVQGTLGYLDPEYMITSQLTEKSDVYSFGVVLAELLTGKKPLAFERSEEERNLSMLFISSMKQNHLFDILESRVVDEGVLEQVLAVAELAKRCLKLKGDARPTMKEVAAELEGLMKFEQHPWVQQSKEEMENLLGEQGACGEGFSIGYNSLNSYAVLDIDMPR